MTSPTFEAINILIRDKRSGYADANTTGQINVKRRYALAIGEFFGLDEEIKASPQEIADWYASTFWTA